jgi:hypothetical protein
MGVDVSELRSYRASLAASTVALVKEVDAILKHGATKIKDEMNADLAGSIHFRGAAGSVDYDPIHSAVTLGYIIGPRKSKKRAAAVTNISYFGGRYGGGGTVDPEAPFNRESVLCEAYVLAAMGRSFA